MIEKSSNGWSDNGDGTHSRTCSVCGETETENHVDADVNNICDGCGITVDIISVTITWGAMEFTYTDASEGTWNPLTHTYKNATVGEWTCNADTNKITVTSESNVNLTASFSYKKAEDVTVDGSFTDGTNPITVLPVARKMRLQRLLLTLSLTVSRMKHQTELLWEL